MKQIRVLQFITPSGFYGAERWVLALANNIDNQKVVCDIAVSDEGGGQDLSVAKLYPKSAGETHYVKMQGRFDIRSVFKLAKIIKERNIDVIHTHGYKSDILGLLAAKLAGIKCVSTPHGFSNQVNFKLATFIKIGSFMLRYFNAVVPLSEELMADMERLNVPKKKTHFIRNGVDLKEIDQTIANLKDDGSESQDEKIIGFIGQMIPRKGVPDLLDVFEALTKKHSNLKLWLLGDGVQRAELEEKASSMSCSNSVEFLGFRDDRLELLKKFDLFVMTSSLEGIPRCMMEAMAVGVPIAAYDIPGVDQLVDQGETGLLAPHGDKKALENACDQILQDETLSDQLADAARKKVKAVYSAERMANEYYDIYNQLLTK